MKLLSQFLLTYLLNACWQIAFIAGTISLIVRLLRKSSCRFQHRLWVSALLLSFALPIVTTTAVLSSRVLSGVRQPELPALAIVNPVELPPLDQPTALSIPADRDTSFAVSRKLAAALLALYVLLLCYRVVRLGLAAQRTRAITKSAFEVELNPQLLAIIEKCQTAFTVAALKLRSSRSVHVPLTVGVRQPLVILPEELFQQGDEELLTSAIGHEAVHVGRRDCLLNLIYEILYLPLSFHPAVALIRLRIKQTRELCCDELVADRLLQSNIYARSLVRLAGSAAPFGHLAPTTTVGIADADILEERIMSLLNRPKTSRSSKQLVLVAVVLILALPCIASAAFAFRFEITEQDPALSAPQESATKAKAEKERAESEQYKKGFQLGQEEKERRERAERDPAYREKLEQQQGEERELKERTERELVELNKAIERETNSDKRAQLEAELKQKLAAGRAGIETILMYGDRQSSGPGLAVAKWAKISMKDAIQIANGQHPGTVLQCRLVGEREDRVFYDVVILSAVEENPVTVHVMVNAVNGTIVTVNKTGRSEAPVNGATLNGKATRLPLPGYPEIAKAAHASGSVGVEITIDEVGNVIAARAISGHPLLQAAAVSAARKAQFSPTQVNGEPVKVTGVVTYNFVAN